MSLTVEKLENTHTGSPYEMCVLTPPVLDEWAKEVGITRLHPLSLGAFLLSHAGNAEALMKQFTDITRGVPLGMIPDGVDEENKLVNVKLTDCYFIALTPRMMKWMTELLESWVVGQRQGGTIPG